MMRVNVLLLHISSVYRISTGPCTSLKLSFLIIRGINPVKWIVTLLHEEIISRVRFYVYMV
jgi:hypothetical protein